MIDRHRRLVADTGNGVSPPSSGVAEWERDGRAVASSRVAGSGWMPDAGRVIVNPISGERIVIRESGAQTGGQLLCFDLFLPAGAHVPARHVHPGQEERFTVVSGLMRFRLGRRTILAHPGETILVPAGAAHWFGNAGAEVAHARVETRPALRMEELFETTAAMGVAGRFRATGLPRLSDLARVLLEFQREIAVPGVPACVVRALLTPLARLGRRRAGAPPDLARLDEEPLAHAHADARGSSGERAREGGRHGPG
jgi:quercetin dioxygenase-like cupin family protein